MKIAATEFLMVRFASVAAPLLVTIGNLESRSLGATLSAISLTKPVFITGLARAGTTILLEELSKAPGVATHRYCDFPLLHIPYIWNRLLNRLAVGQKAVERPHKDRIQITHASPEAFEEPLWQTFFPHIHDPGAIHRLTAQQRNPEFDAFFTDHLRKILIVRGGDRYLSKGNYNVVRIEYLARLFPDARFVIPVRHPYTHTHSLVRQHALFSDYARNDARVPRYLAAAGHYEFGPQRVPVNLSIEAGDRIRSAWRQGDDYAGYAAQWAEIYRFVDQLRQRDDDVAQRMLVITYEEFCSNPRGILTRIVEHAGLALPETSGADPFAHIAPSDHGESLSPEIRATIRRETEGVAAGFGYTL
ncbi:MAG: sulfotransferase family protein [Planctomycetaceae bacterium]